jgi:hypothetical protein
MIFERTGSWMPVFALVIGMDILTGLLALFVLKPLRRRSQATARITSATACPAAASP